MTQTSTNVFHYCIESVLALRTLAQCTVLAYLCHSTRVWHTIPNEPTAHCILDNKEQLSNHLTLAYRTQT